MTIKKNTAYDNLVFQDFLTFDRVKFKISHLPKEIRGRVLDLGCGKGQLLFALQQMGFAGEYLGIDNDELCIESARDFFESGVLKCQAEFLHDDCYKVVSDQVGKFNLVFCWGLISFIDSYEDFLTNLLKNKLKRGGVLSLWGGFNENDFDVYVKYRRRTGEPESGLNVVGIDNIVSICENLKCDITIHNYQPKSSIEQDTSNPLKSYSEKTIDGRFLIFNGLSIVRNFKHVIIKKM